jgi:serine/threonine-protein kinase
MPYVAGESLRHRLARETELPVSDAIRIATEIAEALDYAHRHGVIHRDIKPDNVLFHDGRALVADFGIALAGSRGGAGTGGIGGARITKTGTSLGTPQYMSPEQAAGEHTLDPRSDVYALGTVLYEMLAGEPPFTGPSAQGILARVMTEEPRPLGLRRKTVPTHVETAVARSLEKLPADRFQTAAQFRDALSGKTAASPAGALPCRPAERDGRRLRGRWWASSRSRSPGWGSNSAAPASRRPGRCGTASSSTRASGRPSLRSSASPPTAGSFSSPPPSADGRRFCGASSTGGA